MSETEQEFYDDLLGRGAGDPDFYQNPSEPDEVDDEVET